MAVDCLSDCGAAVADKSRNHLDGLGVRAEVRRVALLNLSRLFRRLSSTALSPALATSPERRGRPGGGRVSAAVGWDLVREWAVERTSGVNGSSNSSNARSVKPVPFPDYARRRPICSNSGRANVARDPTMIDWPVFLPRLSGRQVAGHCGLTWRTIWT
jgi:hypothetical protein